MYKMLKFLQKRKITYALILSLIGVLGGMGVSKIDLLAPFTWLFYAAVLMIGILPTKKVHTFVGRLRLLYLGAIISAVCMTQVQVAVERFGDMWGIFLITVGITMVVILVQSLIKTKQFEALAIGAIIYLLSLSISFLPILAYFVTVVLIFLACVSVIVARLIDQKLPKLLAR